MDYVDVTVRISPRTVPTYTVAVSSPQGSCESTLELPFSLDALAGVVFGVAQTLRDLTPVELPEDVAGGPKPPDPRTLGEQLFTALFQADARSVFDRTAAAAQVRDGGIRLRLMMDLRHTGMTEVASLPWELMRPRDQGPLVVSNQTLLVRSPDIVQATEPRPFEPPLRILLVISNPRGSVPLNLEEERARITQVWGPLPDVLVDTCPPVLSRLLDRLRETDYHVIHYMGHGEFEQASGRGALVMETIEGGRDLVTGEDLGVALRDELRALRLVFLNACKSGATGRRAGVDPFAGIATGLLQAGVPAVVAMQFPISDRAAITFSETFYQCVAKGDPVDVAMAEGRKKLWQLEEWATPVLFLRSRDGVLFERRPAAPATDAFGDGDPEAFRVYLATASEALARTRRQLAKQLAAEGVRVVDEVPIDDPAAHAGAVQRLVRRADLSVHLLGDQPGAPIDDEDADTLRTWPLRELQLGIEAARSQLVLLPDTVSLDHLEDPAYAARLRELIHMPRDASQFELVVTGRTQLAVETLAKLRRLRAARSRVAAPAADAAPVTALVDLHHTDFEQAQDLLRHLSRRNISWAVTSRLGTPGESIAAFDEVLGRARLYIVVFGGVAREWVDRRLEAALQRIASPDGATRCVGVYLAPPVKGGPDIRFDRVHDVADNMTGFDPGTVDALIERARR
jgi:hypothetical protein